MNDPRRHALLSLCATLLSSAAGIAGAQSDISPGQRGGAGKRVLLIGVDPAVVDYSKIPGLDAVKLRTTVEAQRAKLVALGHAAQWCFIDTGTTAQGRVVDVLATASFDVVLIGAGVRLPPENLLLFERVINAVHQQAPGARICFSKNADDTVAAVQRWL